MNLDVIIQNIQEVLSEIKTENNLTKTLFVEGIINYILDEDIHEISMLCLTLRFLPLKTWDTVYMQKIQQSS